MDIRDWNERIDTFIKEENSGIGRTVPVYRIYCQDGTDRSGGGLYNETVTADTIGRFARALGDSNPLYSDPVYAREGIYGGIIAPPLLECCICSTFIGGRMPRVRGISVYDGGTKWERFVPIRPGDSFTAQTEYLGIEEITKPGAGSRLLLRSHEIRLSNQTGIMVSRLTARSLISCAPPEKTENSGGSAVKKSAAEGSAENRLSEEGPALIKPLAEGSAGNRPSAQGSAAGKTAGSVSQPVLSRPHYSQEELEAVGRNLDAQLSGDLRRGSRPRYWEEVQTGEELPEEVVGPYDESDGSALMAAIGAANAFATKWAAVRFRKGSGLIDPETGARRHPIDRHMSDAAARAQGLPRAVVSGVHSQALLAKLAGDWMGDAGFLRSLDCRCRRPLYFGDLSIQRGYVTGKNRDEKTGECFVTLRLEGVRQDGVVHTEAEAAVRLPSRPE